MIRTHHAMIRLLAVLLSVLTVSSLLTACGAGKDVTESTTTTAASQEQTTVQTTTTAAPAEPGTPVKTDGAPVELTEGFSLLCGDTQNDATLILANTLRTKIKAKTGIAVSMGYASSPKEKEIILGYQGDRAACAPAYQTIGGGDYTVHTEGNTVVLGAWTNANLSAAADLFLNQALVKEGDRWMIYPYRVNFGAVEAVGVDLSQYRIVYAAGAGNYLKNTVVPYLQTLLKEQYGTDVVAVSDAEAPTDYEIVLGDTNRSTDTIRGYLNDGKKLTAYGHAIITDGTRIYLLSKSEFAIYYAASTLCQQAKPEIGPSAFCMSAEPWS